MRGIRIVVCSMGLMLVAACAVELNSEASISDPRTIGVNEDFILVKTEIVAHSVTRSGQHRSALSLTVRNDSGVNHTFVAAVIRCTDPNIRIVDPLVTFGAVADGNTAISIATVTLIGYNPAAQFQLPVEVSIYTLPEWVSHKLTDAYARLLILHNSQGMLAASNYANRWHYRHVLGRSRTMLLDSEISINALRNDNVQQWITDNGGEVFGTTPQIIHALIPLGRLEDLLMQEGVLSIQATETCLISATITEGVEITGADEWHEAGFLGTDIKVAVLDPSYYVRYNNPLNDPYELRRAAGDLPNDIWGVGLFGQFFGCGMSIEKSNHILLCAEVLYDVAPGIQLYLVGYDGSVEFANAVDYLINEAGVNIITHSGCSPLSCTDGNSLQSVKVNDARENGILWFDAAGNEAKGHWEGRYEDQNTGCHVWNSETMDTRLGVEINGPVGIYLSWSDWAQDLYKAEKASGEEVYYSQGNRFNQDYRLLLYRAGTQEIVISSNNPQESSRYFSPTESIEWVEVSAEDYGKYEIVVEPVNISGETEYLELFVWGASSLDNGRQIEHCVETGSIYAPADAAGGITVGGVSFDSEVMGSSSRGRVNAIGGAQPSAQSLEKPDLMAPGIAQVWPGDVYVFGTSFAAPLVAGVAALVGEKQGCFNAQNVADWLYTNALDMPDAFTGHGRIQAGPIYIIPQGEDIEVEGMLSLTGSSFNAKIVLRTDEGAVYTLAGPLACCREVGCSDRGFPNDLCGLSARRVKVQGVNQGPSGYGSQTSIFVVSYALISEFLIGCVEVNENVAVVREYLPQRIGFTLFEEDFESDGTPISLENTRGRRIRDRGDKQLIWYRGLPQDDGTIMIINYGVIRS